MTYSLLSRLFCCQLCEAIRIRILHEFRIELEDRILTVVAWNLVVVCPACSDTLEPLADVAVQMVIDCCNIKQQDHDVDGQVCEVGVFIIAEVYQSHVKVAVKGIAVEEEPECVVLSKEYVVISLH